MTKLLPLLLVAVLAIPAIARAEPATIVSRELPVAGGRTPAAATPRFNLVGLHWLGTGDVRFRTRNLAGRWSAWHAAAPEDEDRPDRQALEGSRSKAGWRIGNPYWAGTSDGLQVRTVGKVTRVRAYYVRSTPEPSPPRTIAQAGQPPIVPRLSWGANELLKRAPPYYASSLSFAVVHHTAGSNTYTRTQSAAILKAIQVYHVQGNGWNDIGYNFLVDKYGQVFEGRFGGIERNVVGAHAEGFNTGSVGVALLGNYGPGTVTPAARAALVRLLAWRLDVAHVDPLSTFNWLSGGNGRFPRGVPVFLRAVVGHRDTGFTSCPGDKLYAQLDAFAQSVAITGTPKLYAPLVRGAPGGSVHFTARLSGVVPWTVSVLDSAGVPVAEGAGLGPLLDWTWDATSVPPGAYTWRLGGEGIRPATGSFGSPTTVGLALTRVTATPSAVTPNGDGVDDQAVVSYRLSLPATVTAKLHDSAGAELATLFTEPKPAGDQSFTFIPQSLADGTYRIVLTAVGARGRVVTASVDLLVNRVLSAFAASRPSFSPNGDGRVDRLAFTFALASPAQVGLRILRDDAWIATPFSGPLPPGPQTLSWDGTKRLGRALDGTYAAELTVADAAGTVTQRIPFVVDSTAPVLRLVSVRPLRVQVSEPGEVVVVTDGRRQVIATPRAGVYAVPGVAASRRVRAVAWDRSGNASRPATHPKRR